MELERSATCGPETGHQEHWATSQKREAASQWQQRFAVYRRIFEKPSAHKRQKQIEFRKTGVHDNRRFVTEPIELRLQDEKLEKDVQPICQKRLSDLRVRNKDINQEQEEQSITWRQLLDSKWERQAGWKTCFQLWESLEQWDQEEVRQYYICLWQECEPISVKIAQDFVTNRERNSSDGTRTSSFVQRRKCIEVRVQARQPSDWCLVQPNWPADAAEWDQHEAADVCEQSRKATWGDTTKLW